VPYEYVNILTEQPKAEELIKLADLGNITVMDLLNKKSKTFRDLKVDVSNFSPGEIAELLHHNPKALYRPLLAGGNNLVVGFKPDEMKELLTAGGF
jgi:arsenate reductase-like glutaredoxin family protein